MNFTVWMQQFTFVLPVLIFAMGYWRSSRKGCLIHSELQQLLQTVPYIFLIGFPKKNPLKDQNLGKGIIFFYHWPCKDHDAPFLFSLKDCSRATPTVTGYKPVLRSLFLYFFHILQSTEVNQHSHSGEYDLCSSKGFQVVK